MNNIKRPNSNYAQDIISKIKKYNGNISNIMSDSENNILTVERFYVSIEKDNIKNLLENIPVEKLNDSGRGFRLTAFKNSKINNVLQVLDATEQQLTSVKGIGNLTAKQVKAAADSILRSLKKDFKFKIDHNKRNNNETNLIIAIYRIKCNRPYLEVCKQIKGNYLAKLTECINLAKLTVSKFKWILSFNTTKEKSIEALQYLSDFLNSSDANNLNHSISNYKYINSFIDENKAWEDFINYPAEYYSILEGIAGIKIDIRKANGDLPKELVERIEDLDLNKSLLKSSLRGYQEFGAKYAIVQKNVLIGDEMGLGKTVEAIAAMAHLKAEGAKYFIVVCPTSVLINWNKEIIKHSDLIPFKLHGSEKERQQEFKYWIEKGGIAVTTYETAKKIEFKYIKKIDLLVADEAHYAKNPLAERTKMLYNLAARSERVLFMTGTPIENRVDEMISLINCLQPEIAKKIKNKNYMYDKKQFKYNIAPVYLRRNQEDVLNELPELIQIEEWVHFGEYEGKVYVEAVKQGRFMSMRQAAWKEDGISNCQKLNRLIEICNEAKENNCKVIVFSFFREIIDTVKKSLGEICMEPITGSVTPTRRQQIVDEFSNKRSGTVLICQIQAGGVGLNIQAANVVVFCEPQIKPALETQAIARAYRMGQINKVVVHRLLTENSVDQRLMEILSKKQQVFDSYARESIVVESSSQAVDITETALIDRILCDEKKRLGYI